MSLEKIKQALRDIKTLVKANPGAFSDRDFNVTLTVDIEADDRESGFTYARSLIIFGDESVIEDEHGISVVVPISENAELVYVYIDPDSFEPERETTELESGQVLTHHRRDECDGMPCCVHAPSEHGMSGWPRQWHPITNTMYRVCPHNAIHPDPDHVTHATGGNMGEILLAMVAHRQEGCDGCCSSGSWRTIGEAMRAMRARRAGGLGS